MADENPKRGRKPEHIKEDQVRQLEELFYKNEDTARSAAEKVGCGRDFAAAQFHIFADKLASSRKTNWIERADDTINQAIEGFTYKIEEAEKKIKQAETVFNEVSKVHFELTPNAMKQFYESAIGKALKDIDADAFIQLRAFFLTYLKQFVDIGQLRATWNREVRQERIYKTELQMQFDDLKLAVPPSIVIESLLEKAIAEKLNLAPAVPKEEVVLKKEKKK